MNATAMVTLSDVLPFAPSGSRSGGADRRERDRRFQAKNQHASAVLAGFLHAGRTLGDAIDLVLDDPTYNRLVADYNTAAKAAPVTEGKIRTADQLGSKAQGDGADALRAIDDLAGVLLGAEEQLRKSPFRFATSTSQAQRDDDLLWFLNDAMVPSVVSRALLGLLRWEVAMVALKNFFGGGSLWTPPPVGLTELARVALDGLRDHAVLYASVLGDAIPEAVVAAADRVDLGARLERQRDAVLALDEISAAG